ncbi:MAG: hypothetical protein RL346_1480 [Verrucomicrobiota bacterium]|jgi:peptidoglycan hydrolase CwlO-like protein
MATAFGIITFIVLLASAFVAQKNNERMAHEIEQRDQALRNQNASEKELKRNQETFAALEEEIPRILAETEAARNQEKELREVNTKLKEDIEFKTGKVASLQREYDDAKNTVLLVGEPSSLVAKAKEMKIKSQELDVVIANKESKVENLNAENTSAADLASRLKDNIDTIGRGESLPNLKTRISHIYPNWGFVTLSGGYQSGVTGGSPLQVTRDGAVIAKLIVSTVERSSASASIVPDSLAPDITLRVGDTVVPGQ